MSSRLYRRFVAVSATAIIAATGLTACGAGKDENTIRLGSTDSTLKQFEAWKDAAEKEGIKLEVVNFGDYSTVNKSLSEGDIDVNSFQHLKFLAEYNVGTGDNLVPIGSTYIVPLALYWKDHTSLDGIEGSSIAIPNDPSNQGRAINVLAAAGLVKLKKEGLVTPTPADIDEAASKVKIQPVDAAQTPTAWGEGKPAIINNSFLDRANIDPKTAVFSDDPSSPEAEPYINVIVVKPERAQDEKLKKLAEIWHSPEIVAADQEDTAGTSVPVKRSAENLSEILARLEKEKKAG